MDDLQDEPGEDDGDDLTSSYQWDYDTDLDWSFVSLVIPANWIVSGVAAFDDEVKCLLDNYALTV